MTSYIARRLLMMIPTLLGVAILTFFMLRVVPGDVVQVKLMADGGMVSPEAIEAERVRLGLDQSLTVQFLDWMRGIFTLDLGNSMWTGRPVAAEIASRFLVTFQAALMATIIAVLIAVPLGTVSALYMGIGSRLYRPRDHDRRAGAAVLLDWHARSLVPAALRPLAAADQLCFADRGPLGQFHPDDLAIHGGWLPVFGGSGPLIRSSLLDVLNEDYIRTARAKGVPARTVIWLHALKNALLPAVTVVGLEFAFLIGGLVVTEQVFNLNGVGKLFIQAVEHHDFTMIQGLVMMFAVIYVLANLIVDLIYAAIDPRIRYR